MQMKDGNPILSHSTVYKKNVFLVFHRAAQKLLGIGCILANDFHLLLPIGTVYL